MQVEQGLHSKTHIILNKWKLQKKKASLGTARLIDLGKQGPPSDISSLSPSRRP
jgi:hypothetical protein